MQCTRRPDVSPHTRIEMVSLAWLYQGVYRKMTHIARSYQISRTFLSQLMFLANRQLEMLCSDAKRLLQQDPRHLDHLLWLFRLEGNGSLLSLASILKALEYHPHALGSLRQFFHSAGQRLPSTLVMPSKTCVLYRSDAIFAIQAPLVVTIDARSTTILNIKLVSDRSAETWTAHFAALDQHHCVSLGMASDRGRGLVAGYQAAGDRALWVAEYCHELQDLFALLHQLECQASAAINTEYDAARTFVNAKSEANLHQRLQQYERAHDTCEQAITLYDQLDLWLHWLREALHVCSPHGKLRHPEGVRSELLSLVDRLEALDYAAIPQALKSMRQHLDDLLVPLKQAEAIDAALRLVVPHEA